MTWSHIGFFTVMVCLGTLSAGQPDLEDEQFIRKMVTSAFERLNHGDLGAVREFWDENADYVGVDGKLITGHKAIEEFFRQAIKASEGAYSQTATIERIRFLNPDLAIVDGSWTVTGARDTTGKTLPPIKGRGVEVAQKKNGRWRFVATREMVIWKGE